MLQSVIMKPLSFRPRCSVYMGSRMLTAGLMPSADDSFSDLAEFIPPDAKFALQPKIQTITESHAFTDQPGQAYILRFYR